jgi:hypothetical protein
MIKATRHTPRINSTTSTLKIDKAFICMMPSAPQLFLTNQPSLLYPSLSSGCTERWCSPDGDRGTEKLTSRKAKGFFSPGELDSSADNPEYNWMPDGRCDS